MDILLSIAQLPRATFYYHLKRMEQADKYEVAKMEIAALCHENKGRYGYIEALPHFLSGTDEDHAIQYIMGYTSRLFRPENIGPCERDENQEHPFFRDSNPYWRELQEAMDAFNDPEILSNRPLLYVYACELITRAHRLYLQIREVQFRSIDREKFHALMLMPQNKYMGSAS